jgi:hypothetical protein
MGMKVTSSRKRSGGRVSRRSGGRRFVAGATKETEMTDVITIRPSTLADRSAVLRLAALDDRDAPAGDALLGFVDGELRAAVSFEDGAAVADPFHLTDELVGLLRARTVQDQVRDGWLRRALRWAPGSRRQAVGRA